MDKTWRKHFPDGERQITTTCLGYLAAVVSSVPSDVREAARCGLEDEENYVWCKYYTNHGLALCGYAEVYLSPNTFNSALQDIYISVQKHLMADRLPWANASAHTSELLDEIVYSVIVKSYTHPLIDLLSNEDTLPYRLLLVAKLLIRCIPSARPLTANELRAAAKKLPSEIEDTYKMAMTRIQEQEPHLAELGKQALSWVYLSKRQLTAMELRHALSFQWFKVISPNPIVNEDQILSASAGLISFVNLQDEQSTAMGCQFFRESYLQ